MARFGAEAVKGTGALVLVNELGTVELPPDFVFRELLELDPSVEDLPAVIATWGLAGERGAFTFDYMPGHTAALRPDDHVIGEELAAWQDVIRRADLIHPEAALWHLRVLRVLAHHLLVYLESGDKGDPLIVGAWQREIGSTAPRDVFGAWTYWEAFMNAGLSAFTVHVLATDGREPWGVPPTGLYNACCLQLAQYLASESTVQRCANERCGRPFTRQRGRARDDYGQHRSRGVRYCSHLCAKAQSERDRRRRRTQEDEAVTGGRTPGRSTIREERS